MNEILAIQGLTVASRGNEQQPVLDGVSLLVGEGRVLCVVGESGSGKSMTASTIMRLLPKGFRATAGRVLLRDRDLLGASEARMCSIRGAEIGMIFQEPMTALNPLKKIGNQIGEIFRIHTSYSPAEIGERVAALLENVQIADPQGVASSYPHELSGGQRQRAMIAMAVALEPKLLIADEPTTALDVTTQAQILHLIKNLQERTGTSVLFITHDFGVVAEIADDVVVMRHGRVVESGPASDVLDNPQHSYSRHLMATVPSLVPRVEQANSEDDPILDLKHVSKTYRSGNLWRGRRTTYAVKDVNIVLRRGGTLGIVGESGSGKSTLARCIVRLIDPEAGEIRLNDVDIAPLPPRQMLPHRRMIQMVFQDPFESLNPRRTVGQLVAQGPILQGVQRSTAITQARELFKLVGLDPEMVDRYPHEFSGGQRQRIALARALAVNPDVLVADEPVSALDVAVQAQVLDLLSDLKGRLGLSMVFITHDLRVAAQVCDQVAIMKNGEIVEQGSTFDVFRSPKHDYTKTLLASVPGRHWVPPSHDPDRGTG